MMKNFSKLSTIKEVLLTLNGFPHHVVFCFMRKLSQEYTGIQVEVSLIETALKFCQQEYLYFYKNTTRA